MSYRAQAFPTAVEASPEHGMVAGNMDGAVKITRELQGILHTLEKRPPPTFPPMPDPMPTILPMAAVCAAAQTTSVALIELIKHALKPYIQ